MGALGVRRSRSLSQTDDRPLRRFDFELLEYGNNKGGVKLKHISARSNHSQIAKWTLGTTVPSAP